MDITTAKAVQQSLPGADSWRYSHLRYHTDSMRQYGAAELFREAYLLLLDSITLRRRGQLMREHRLLQEYWPHMMSRNLPKIPAILQRANLFHLENFKIAAGFELFINAALIEKGYIAHQIKKNPLRDMQMTRPISVAEFITLHPPRFNGQQNYLPDLKEASLNFNNLLMDPYCSAIGLSPHERDVIEEYRQHRNHIHLPPDFSGAGLKAQDLKSKIEFLVSFINNQIVARFDALNAQLVTPVRVIKLLSLA